MPGDDKMKADQMRAFVSYMMAHPGKKLQFMGTEFAQKNEWNYEKELEWGLLQYPEHQQAQAFFRAVNQLLSQSRPELWEIDFSWEGFEWISNDDYQQSVIAFRRKAKDGAGAGGGVQLCPRPAGELLHRRAHAGASGQRCSLRTPRSLAAAA